MAIAMAEKHEAVLKLVYQRQQYAQQAHGHLDKWTLLKIVGLFVMMNFANKSSCNATTLALKIHVAYLVKIFVHIFLGNVLER